VKRLFKLLFFLALVAGVLAGMSYVGARARVGTLLGSNPPLGNRSIRFEFEGVSNLPGQPRAWVFTFGSSTLPGVSHVRIVVSPTGEILSFEPRDLDIRLEQWEESKLPAELR
jgi:uncharacterized protein YneF (UPF0154 family)